MKTTLLYFIVICILIMMGISQISELQQIDAIKDLQIQVEELKK